MAKTKKRKRKYPQVRCFHCLEILAEYNPDNSDHTRWIHWYKRPALDSWPKDTLNNGYACAAGDGVYSNIVFDSNRGWTIRYYDEDWMKHVHLRYYDR